jgi:hypothetical protein
VKHALAGVAAVLFLMPGDARAEYRPVPPALSPSVQADLGLSVIGLGYEHPVAGQVSLQVEANLFSTWFAPVFDVGDDVIGFGGGVRATWFARETGHGLYVTPYVRVSRVTGERDDEKGTGVGFSAGAFVGWALGLGEKIDLRLGAGAQYISYAVDTDAGEVEVKTPFVALDVLLAYKL